MKIKELKKTVNVSWSPAEQFPLMLAAGSAAQQVDASFNSSSFLELYAVNLSDSSLDLEPSASTPTQHKFQKLVWSGAGVIVGGCDGGLLQFYNSEKLLHSANESLVGSSSKHSGAVSALDINPYQKNLLASGASDSEIFIWDLNNTSQPMAPGNRHQPYEHVQGLAWNQQVQHILGSTFATRCLVWDLRKNEPIMKLSDSQSRTRWRALAWHPSVATQLCIASEEDQVPVIQLWDLRLAASPVVTMEGHQKGVMSLSWSHHDPDLLLSTGKDGRLLCWNPNNTKPGGEIVVELEWGARFALSAAWAPRCAGLLAACSDTVALHDLLGAGPASESASNASSFLESFGGAAGLQALPAVAAPAPLRLRPLPTHAPRWLRRPAAARFAFGGKLVTFEKQPQEAASQKLVYVSQVITDPEVVERATELDAVLSLTNSQESGATEKLAEYCRQKGDEAEDQNERYLWFFLRANFLPTFRTEILNLLGFKQDEIPHRFKGQANAEPTHDLTGLSRGESTETEAELSTDTSTDLSDTQTQIERKLSNLDLEPNVSNVLIPNDEDSTSLICRALVCGNLEEAVELCLESKRIADAMIVASLGSQELLFKVQKYHLNTTAADPVSLLSGSLLRSKWDILIQSASPNSWKNTLAALVTHCDAESLAHYCEMLGERLRNSGQASAAALCYACAADGNAAAAVRTDQRAPLALLLRTAAAVRARHSPADGKIEQVLTEYAGQLAGQGCLHSALSALNGLACPLQQRLTRALGLDDRASKHQQQTHQFVQRARTVSGQSQVRGHYGQNDIYNNGERPWPSASPMPQPPRPPSVGNSTGGLTSRSKYKVDPSVQSAPLYNQYSFNNPISSQPQAFGYNSPIPEQYSAASVPGHNFTPINQTSSINPNLNPLHVLNPISPAPMSAAMPNTMNSASLNTMNMAPLNPMNSAPLNPMNSAPLNPMNLGSLNPMNSAALNPMNPAPLNPMNSASLNSMNPTVNGGYYNQAPGQSAPAPLPPAKPVQPGWNDPPMMTSKQKDVCYESMSALHAGTRQWGHIIEHRRHLDEPKQEVQQQAPITHPLFGVEPPQHVPLVPNQYPTQPGQYPGQDPYVHQGQIGPYPSQGYGGPPVQQIPGQQYHDQSQYSSSGRGGYQQQTEMVAPVETPVVKPPLPQQYEPLQETFDGLRDQCYQMANNTQVKRKLEDVQKRLEILYDLLRENKLSEAAVGVLQTCAGAARAGDATGALAAAGALAGGADFAAVASFLPGLKVLMQLAMQMQQR